MEQYLRSNRMLGLLCALWFPTWESAKSDASSEFPMQKYPGMSVDPAMNVIINVSCVSPNPLHFALIASGYRWKQKLRRFWGRRRRAKNILYQFLCIMSTGDILVAKTCLQRKKALREIGDGQLIEAVESFVGDRTRAVDWRLIHSISILNFLRQRWININIVFERFN